MQDHRRSIGTNQAMETAGIRAATSVVGKALSPLSDGVLEAWAASTKLGSNMEALKMKLLHAQGILKSAQGREIHNSSLAELLNKLQHLAYGADDALDEIEYFRIQDELDGTYHAADAHAAGCAQDLALNARHTVRACVNKLKFPICLRSARRDDPDEQDDGGKNGCLSGLRFCGGRHEIGSSSQSPANQLGVQEVQGGCMPKAVHSFGKQLSCFSLLPSLDHDAQTSLVGNPNMTRKSSSLQTPKLKFDRVQMSRKILDITDQLKPVCDNVSSILSLELLNSSRTPTEDRAMNRPKTTPQIIQPKLYGRDKHKKSVVDEIINGECCELTVLPIVGPGGIGKTTFTQHIYEEMKSRFQVPIWICVSQNFNANRLANDIVKKIPKVNNENKACSNEELIKQRLKGKRVLLVLDDVWEYNENEWKKIIALFRNQGIKGNMVIVTTRIPKVANTVKTTKCSLELERLCSEDIMCFFEECVFVDQKPWVDHPGLVGVGSKIVDKLKGSPLAAKTVGRLLRNNLTLNHWRSVLESKEWESQTDENDIMPALKLSYDYLPFHLQQCFYFCSLFPEDYEFGSEELVHFWIGLDILHSCDRNNRKIVVGLCYLNDLVNSGFFKMNEKEDGRPYYNIHDLLHELAVKVSSYQCLSIYSFKARDVHITPYIRHLSIIVDDTDVKDRISFEEYGRNLSALDKRLKVENLHTFMLFGDHHGSFAKTFGGLFKEATGLRTISLSGVSYNVENILHNFSKLVHLRYLRIKALNYWELCLPSTLFRLYHLEVIDLQTNNHISFSEDEHMSNLVNLHHFLVPKNMFNLHSDIFGVGKLKLLHELKEFRVGKESEGFEVSQLGQLREIGGSLGISNLEKVKTKEEASELKLMHKKHLKELTLEWNDECSKKDPVQEVNILESLVPHSDLQGLHIKGHGGSNCPSWLCTNLSVKCLESLCLDGVSWNNLPPLGEMWVVNERGEEYQGCSISPPSFHNLKRLQLSNISSVIKWVGSGACPFFSHLEVLIVKNCSELIELPFSHPTCREAHKEDKMAWFSKLRELVIIDCPKLAALPPIPWRMHPRCSAQIVRAGLFFEQLLYPGEYGPKESMEVEGKVGHGDVLWNGLNFSNLTDLEVLRMKKCPPLPLDRLQLLASLKRIQISGSSSIVLPPVQGEVHGIYRFPCEDLVIINCDTSGEELTLLLSFLPNLSKLEIRSCKNITGLGVAENAATISEERQQQTRGDEEIMTAGAAEGLTFLPLQLQELGIYACSKLRLLSNPPHDDHAGGGGLQRLCSLRVLTVYDCPEFLSSYPSSSSFCPFPTSLQHLDLDSLKRTETLSNLTSLTQLTLYDSEGSGEEGLWPLLAHGRLTELALHIPDFFAPSDPSRPHDKEVFSRSSKLLDLCTSHNTGFLATPICNLFSSTLTRLDLRLDDEVERLTKEQEDALELLTSLQELRFWYGEKLQRLPAGLQKLTNLKKLEIRWCSCIQSLPSLPSSLQDLGIQECDAFKSLPNSLPSSLEKLKISSCSAIQSLPSLPSSLRELEILHCGAFKSLSNSLPSSLQKLEIFGCKAIKSLPKDGLPRSMLELDVHLNNSEELKRACRKLIGTIPIIRA